MKGNGPATLALAFALEDTILDEVAPIVEIQNAIPHASSVERPGNNAHGLVERRTGWSFGGWVGIRVI